MAGNTGRESMFSLNNKNGHDPEERIGKGLKGIRVSYMSLLCLQPPGLTQPICLCFGRSHKRANGPETAVKKPKNSLVIQVKN